MGGTWAMKLDEYVKQTLLDITKGVDQAKREASLHIAPSSIDGQKLTEPQMARFEVAVTVTAEGGGGIRVFSLGDLKAQGGSAHTNTIAFEVPIYFNLTTPLHPLHNEIYADDISDEEQNR